MPRAGNLYFCSEENIKHYMGRVKRIWYLSPMRAEKVQASLRIRAVSPEPPLLAHTSRESRGTFRQKPRYLAPLNCWTCAVKICHDGMLEDTNSLDGAHIGNRWCFSCESYFLKFQKFCPVMLLKFISLPFHLQAYKTLNNRSCFSSVKFLFL